MLSKALNLALPLSAIVLVMAAVSVVLPWSTWPIVPTLTCGLVRSNFCLAIGVSVPPQRAISLSGAHQDEDPQPCGSCVWSPCRDSNPRPPLYQRGALPTELH